VTGSRPRLYLLGQGLVWGLLAVFAGLFLFCAALRIFYPFELEWLEGEMICHGLQILQGLPVYGPPSAQFIAESYPPVYYYLTAAVFKIAGSVSFPLLRLVSVASLAGLLLLLYRSVRREQGSAATALIACGFFLSFYELHGPWYDIGRVDMLFFFLIMSGLYCLAYSSNRLAGIAAGSALLVAACYTKQSGVYYLPFAFLYLMLQNRRHALVFLGLTSALVLGAFLGLNRASDGWFATYTLFNPLRYNELLNKPIEEIPFKMLFEFRERIWPEIRYEILYKLPVFFTLTGGYLLHRALTLTKSSRVNIWELTALPAIISYFSIRPHLGSEKNDFMYLTLWGCLLLGFLLTKIAKSYADDARHSVKTVLYLLLAGQLALQLYDPQKLVPAPGSAQKGRQIIELIGSMPGQVFLPYHSYYGIMAGKEKIMNGGAYWAWQILSKEPYRPAELLEKIRRKYYCAIIVDDRAYMTAKGDRVLLDNLKIFMSSGDELAGAIQEHYQPGGRLPYDDEDQFLDTTGLFTRPELILVPKP
jgi:hypothetical protein